MPIPWTVFEFGAQGTPAEIWMRDIQEFLREHSKLAYSKAELKEILSQTRSSKDEDFERALSWLSDLGSIACRHMEGDFYYKYLEEIPELPPVGAKLF